MIISSLCNAYETCNKVGDGFQELTLPLAAPSGAIILAGIQLKCPMAWLQSLLDCLSAKLCSGNSGCPFDKRCYTKLSSGGVGKKTALCCRTYMVRCNSLVSLESF